VIQLSRRLPYQAFSSMVKVKTLKQGPCWYFLMQTEVSTSSRNYHCSFHLEVFRVSYFSQGMEVLLLPNSSKDNIGVELERVEMDSYGSWVF
jgi:hypothetical protein